MTSACTRRARGRHRRGGERRALSARSSPASPGLVHSALHIGGVGV
jgi:hypothetical protein